jgi:hypothetical protein
MEKPTALTTSQSTFSPLLSLPHKIRDKEKLKLSLSLVKNNHNNHESFASLHDLDYPTTSFGITE